MSCEPLGQYVPDVVDPGTANGEESEMCSLRTYIAKPNFDRNIAPIVVIIPDAFGWTFDNARIMAEEYASRGNFLVLVPDFMNGDHADERILASMDQFNAPDVSLFKKVLLGSQALKRLLPFLYRNRRSVVQQRILSFFETLRNDNTRPIGVAAFGWGGLYAIQLTHPRLSATPGRRTLVDAAFVAHPTSAKVPDDFDLVSVPLSFAIGTEDILVKSSRVNTIREILSRNASPTVEHETVLYQGAKHGFAMRGNQENREERVAGLQAVDQAVAWFVRWLHHTPQETQGLPASDDTVTPPIYTSGPREEDVQL
ncbi:MAG: hypothetical protein M4579_001164 [Chaenotheca gracillima]|nr:MAG: hypothetical protein M4579_001164 [Chaenotheca gracillima]